MIPGMFTLKKRRITVILFLLLLSVCESVQGQSVYEITGQDEHIFSYDQIEIWRNTVHGLPIEEVLEKADQGVFKASKTNTPQVVEASGSDWFRIRLKSADSRNNRYILEFFDQTIDDLTVYVPTREGGYKMFSTGDSRPFGERFFSHKNFTIPLSDPPVDGVYYFNVSSRQVADVIVVLRSERRFVKYVLTEYLIFGIFYGMILVFSFYNLIMYLAIRQAQYLYYVLYILSVGFFEMCIDGLAYQYLWPSYPDWNQYAYAFALYGVSIFALQFTRSLLFTRRKTPFLDRLILITMGLRTALFVFSLLFDKTLLNYKFIELVPLAIAFYSGIYIYYRQGYHPARYFVIGYSFLTLGFLYKLLIMLHVDWLNFGAVSYYSLSICFVIEMLFLSFALGDKVRYLKTRKDRWQVEMMSQMKVNAALKDELNVRLEQEVADRTREITEQTGIIEQKNRELSEINETLEFQAREIRRMNELLEQDNKSLLKDNTLLKTNVEEVRRARVLSEDVNFEEFSKIYPDQESCIAFLEKLKQEKGYKCYKCGNTAYYHGRIQGNRRCTHCSYEESVTAHTLLQNARIPINKAFYIVFLVYSSNGKISSYRLSEMLGIRQSTCWAYSSRIKKAMQDKKRRPKTAQNDKGGWTSILFEDQ